MQPYVFVKNSIKLNTLYPDKNKTVQRRSHIEEPILLAILVLVESSIFRTRFWNML